MDITFYFDPSCPFCWITSRWLLMVEADRNLHVTWKPFSLAIKNDELTGNSTNEHAPLHMSAHRVLRVMLAAEQQGTSLIDLYTAFGIPHHISGDEFDDALITKVLEQKSLPANLLQAADDASYDSALAESIKTATDVAGQDIGVPTIVFTAEDGTKNGFFGPVLQELPDKAEALKLWDGLSQLASDSNFYELKRTRPAGGPDVFSTAKC